MPRRSSSGSGKRLAISLVSPTPAPEKSFALAYVPSQDHRAPDPVEQEWNHGWQVYTRYMPHNEASGRERETQLKRGRDLTRNGHLQRAGCTSDTDAKVHTATPPSSRQGQENHASQHCTVSSRSSSNRRLALYIPPQPRTDKHKRIPSSSSTDTFVSSEPHTSPSRRTLSPNTSSILP